MPAAQRALIVDGAWLVIVRFGATDIPRRFRMLQT
jgi:hypothetical protein